MSYVNVGGGMGRVDRAQRVRSLMPAGSSRGFGAPARPVLRSPNGQIPAAMAIAMRDHALRRMRRRGMGAYATGLCIGGHDSGDGTPCTLAAPGASAWSQAQLDAYNANLNPGVAPWTAQTLIDMAALNAQNANKLMPGSAPDPGRVGGNMYTPGPSDNPILWSSMPDVPPGAAGGTVSIRDNVTGSSAVLTGGNPFTLTIRGAKPNAPVNVQVGSWAARKGTTDAQGSFTLNDTTPAATQTQSQVWTVDGIPSTPSPLVFSIAGTAAPAGGGSSAGGAVTSPGSGMDLSFLTNTVSLGGFDLPIWGIGAAVGLGIFFFSRSGGKARH